MSKKTNKKDLIRIWTEDGMNRLWVNVKELQTMREVTAELATALCQHIVQGMMNAENEMTEADVMEYTEAVCLSIKEAVEIVYNGQEKPVN